MMNERMKNLLPNDRYLLRMNDACKEDYVLALTHLYQPLIGLKAISLYLTLLNDVELLDGPTTHHTLMSMTNLDLDEFYQSRIKLEAIGLMKTYVKEGEYRTFYYELVPPFSVKRFFEDSMLSILLEHHIGKSPFERLKNKLLPKQSHLPELVEKTKRFDEVFSTVKPNISQQKKNPVVSIKEQEKESLVDFEWIEQSLIRNGINPKVILSKGNKEYITSLVKIYHVDNLTLEKAILWSINDGQVLLRDELHEACKDYYAKHYNQPSPKLLPHQEVKEKQVKKAAPKTKEEKLIQHFETITHRELLEDFSKTGYASENEIKMLTNIMLKHGLNQSVMNVLVHYVLQKSDMKLTKNYVEKIATHWARKNVQTAKQAMDLAKQETKLYQTWGSYKRNTAKRKEVLPDWFQIEQEDQRTENKKKLDPDVMKERQELEKALRNVSKL